MTSSTGLTTVAQKLAMIQGLVDDVANMLLESLAEQGDQIPASPANVSVAQGPPRPDGGMNDGEEEAGLALAPRRSLPRPRPRGSAGPVGLGEGGNTPPGPIEREKKLARRALTKATTSRPQPRRRRKRR